MKKPLNTRGIPGRRTAILTLISSGLLWAPTAFAGMGNTGTTFGLTPNDVGSAQANSYFESGPESVYYNPAHLADGEFSELGLGYLYGNPTLEIKSKGGAQPLDRQGSDAVKTLNNKTVVLGLKFNLNNMFKSDRDVGFGLLMGLDNNAKTLFAVNDSTSEQGQFLQYGQKPLFLAVSGGAEIIRGVQVGAGTHMTIAATAPVRLVSELDGQTRQEEIIVRSETDFATLASVTVDWRRVFCESNCPPTGLETVFSYRGKAGFKLDLDANAVIPGTTSPEGLDLTVAAVDGYQPEIHTLALRYGFTPHVLVATALERQGWSALGHTLEKIAPNGNSVKDQGHAEFEDTLVPRLALVFKNVGTLIDIPGYAEIDGSLGYAFEPSPLKDGTTPDVNLLDTDRHVFAAGLALTWHKTRFFSYPVTVSGSYQYHMLEERDFDLTRTEASQANDGDPLFYETVAASGSAHAVNAAITIRF